MTKLVIGFVAGLLTYPLLIAAMHIVLPLIVVGIAAAVFLAAVKTD